MVCSFHLLASFFQILRYMITTATVFKGDPLDPKRGQRYRDEILFPGGSREETDSLKVLLTLALLDDGPPKLISFDRHSSAAHPIVTLSSRNSLAMFLPPTYNWPVLNL